jgi:peroxiredoxin Q/BCP
MLSWLFRRPLPVGQTAPDFTTTDQDGNQVTLSTLRGKNVVLVFYPGDETSICRKQLCEFRDQRPLLSSTETLVFGVNPQSAESHRNFRDKRELGFPLLVDDQKQIARLYNAGGPLIRRTVYLIDKNGVIRFGERGKPSPELVLSSGS